jgi:hypothetical protein
MTTTAITPSQSYLTTAIRAFLLAELPSGTEVVLGQINRVAEPSSTNFVVMTPIRFDRLDTNLDESLDLKMTGSISGTTMTITAVSAKSPGAIVVGAPIFGVGIMAGTTVTAFGTGTGGIGTYTVSQSQTVGSQTLSAGRKAMTQSAMATVQLDFHSENTVEAGNMAQTIATLLRDDYGVTAFANQPSDVVPLYADDPRQMPFINDQQQYEWRWILEARFQVNQQVSVPQEYADAVNVGLIEVDGRYPP